MGNCFRGSGERWIIHRDNKEPWEVLLQERRYQLRVLLEKARRDADELDATMRNLKEPSPEVKLGLFYPSPVKPSDSVAAQVVLENQIASTGLTLERYLEKNFGHRRVDPISRSFIAHLLRKVRSTFESKERKSVRHYEQNLRAFERDKVIRERAAALTSHPLLSYSSREQLSAPGVLRRSSEGSSKGSSAQT